MVTYYPPLEFKDPKSGELTGFDHDLFEAMAKKVGATVNWSEFTFTELLTFAPLKTGRVDIYASGPMTDTPERRQDNSVSFLDFVYEPYFFITLGTKAAHFKSMDALCGKKVAATRASTMTVALVNKWSEENCTKSGKPAVVLVGTAGTPESSLSLKQGRVDAFVNGAGSTGILNKGEGNIYCLLESLYRRTCMVWRI